ncbi:restriction endonuclease [Algoriphagus kandeliae]|uniref:Restriction endonuclease n=1 Tax=Algoriphagus kandeliae TaxID=2562278 RepID=A0A4Y9R0X9_9BACT|nr:restriction endonuclease [Algoriphagus kandeliae]TFV97522.1 restriction endonuclease [Algoriphagus kandeliae]
MSQFARIDKEGEHYINLIKAVGKLSALFSDNSIPYINYRVAENIFCKCFNAINLSRSDTAFDANYQKKGIGIKTFTCQTGSSTEKVAEFNTLSHELKSYSGKDLAKKLAEFRNERIKLAKRTYDLESGLYHIVARQEAKIILFETDYDVIDISSIKNVVEKQASLQFEDNNNSYLFNFSKSTLFRKFHIADDHTAVDIEIIEDPFDLLLELFENKKTEKGKVIKGIDFVILPLYGIKRGMKHVFERSGLNQWNANGRLRDLDEVYVPIPKVIHDNYPGFFPARDTAFNLETPTGETLSAKVCQQNSKALMTKPNKALSDWLLRKVLNLQPGELATIEKLEILGFDSVIVTKKSEDLFSIDIAKSGTFEKFISDPSFTIDDL